VVVLQSPHARTPVPRERQTRREAGAQSLRACEEEERAGSLVAERRGEVESLWRV
jgi:hypothetical protein